MENFIFSASFYAFRMCSSTSVWLMYHATTGTYHTVRYIQKLRSPSKPFIIFDHAPEKCLLKKEDDFELIMTHETLMHDLAILHEHMIKKNDLEIELIEKHKRKQQCRDI